MTTPDRRATSAEDALALAQRAGIHRIALPTPFLVGRVNCYLIEDEPLTLIDTGPNSGKSLDELERALAAHGHRIEDLELIVLTHQHMDHLGLLEILARRSGAEVAALHLLGPVPGELLAQRRGRRRVRSRRHAPPRRARRPGDRARGAGGGVPRVRVERARDPPAARRRRARVPRPDAARPPPARAQPVGHDPVGRRARDADRRRPPARPHLLQPARLPAALGRPRSAAPAGAPPVHGLDAGHPRAAGPAGPAGPRRPDPRPRRADRRAAADAPPPGGSDPSDPGRTSAHRLRDRGPDVGQRGGHAGLPDALGGARTPRSAGAGRAGRRAGPDAVAVFEAL